MLTTPGRDLFLAEYDLKTTHLGLIASVTNFRTPSVTETGYPGYARAAITFGAAADTSPAGGRQVSDSVAVSFPENTGADVSVIGVGAYSASSGGTLYDIGLLGPDAPIVGTVSALTDLITAYAHGLVADQRVFMMAHPFGVPPDVFAENTAYFVLAAGLTADVFALSATSGGAAINATTPGAAWFLPYVAQTISTNSTMTFNINQYVFQI
jgi:hypothetical protein